VCGAGARVKVEAIADRLGELQRELLALDGADASIAVPAERFRAEVDEAENLLRLARTHLIRAVGGRGRG
jgi:hypothetical protein